MKCIASLVVALVAAFTFADSAKATETRFQVCNSTPTPCPQLHFNSTANASAYIIHSPYPQVHTLQCMPYIGIAWGFCDIITYGFTESHMVLITTELRTHNLASCWVRLSMANRATAATQPYDTGTLICGDYFEVSYASPSQWSERSIIINLIAKLAYKRRDSH